MFKKKSSWVVGVVAILAIIIIPLVIFIPGSSSQEDPWSQMPQHAAHTDHTVAALQKEFTSGEEVTEACLQCHPSAGDEMLLSAHFTWESGPYELPGREQEVYGGKKNLINNFCIGITNNEPPCTACHAGYGWEDSTFDFTDKTKIDCLVCHETTGTYVKMNSGYPGEDIDLSAVAQSVGLPDRERCGSCHFKGGGGDAVKHGDLDTSLMFPSDELDVHMGKYDFVCIDCHRTEQHDIGGRSISVSMDSENQIACTDCHSPTPHEDQRIDEHTTNVACQTCHIPEFARKKATKTEWDWSEAGQDLGDDPHHYLKIKGEFVYEDNVVPEYEWYNGEIERYILGDVIDPTTPTEMNPPTSSIVDPTATIWPFKVHYAKQIYDSEYNYLIPPTTAGEGGFWHEFDWDQAARLGAEANGLTYSGEYDFAPTTMHWPITHMVAPKDHALQCDECHVAGGDGVLDWRALGYEGDPMFYGGRDLLLKATGTVPSREGGAQ